MHDLLFLKEEILKELLTYDKVKKEYKYNINCLLAIDMAENSLNYLLKLIQYGIDTYEIEEILN